MYLALFVEDHKVVSKSGIFPHRLMGEFPKSFLRAE